MGFALASTCVCKIKFESCFDQVKIFIFKIEFEDYSRLMSKSKMSYILEKVTSQFKEQAHFRYVSVLF